ncbi:MAG: hypothetical protein LC660_14110 [Desulfobacteraceae bacterium]|nr:hypothetical protein [Desulfobacteraceae bacterium]
MFTDLSGYTAMTERLDLEEGLICLEMGRCLQDIGHLESAKRIFETINATAALSRVDAQIAVVEKHIH